MEKFTQEELRDFISAEQARENSSLPQLKNIFQNIGESINKGNVETDVICKELFPEVIKVLTDLGYDVTVKKYPNDFFDEYNTVISWERGCKTDGKYNLIDKSTS